MWSLYVSTWLEEHTVDEVQSLYIFVSPGIPNKSQSVLLTVGYKKSLLQEVRQKRDISERRNKGWTKHPSTLTLFVTQSLGHCATFKGSSYAKNKYNIFYQKLDAEYSFIQQIFEKTVFSEKNNEELLLGTFDAFLWKGGVLSQKLTYLFLITN